VKVVIADASPLNYLILIGEVELLPRLFGEILVPDVVASELSDPDAPQPVRAWASHPPSWLAIRPTPASSELLERLDEGERAAILLAEAQEAPVLLIIDDAEGRAEAERRGIPATGTLGVLRAAAIRNLVDFAIALDRLRSTNFRAPALLIEQLLVEDNQRKRCRK
jgi:predicted nucleic acid-binding protein